MHANFKTFPHANMPGCGLDAVAWLFVSVLPNSRAASGPSTATMTPRFAITGVERPDRVIEAGRVLLAGVTCRLSKVGQLVMVSCRTHQLNVHSDLATFGNGTSCCAAIQCPGFSKVIRYQATGTTAAPLVHKCIAVCDGLSSCKQFMTRTYLLHLGIQ